MKEDTLRISTRAELIALAAKLGVRPDWHEPDEQEVTAQVHGASFDNAGFWGGEDRKFRLASPDLHFSPGSEELWVELRQDGEPVGEVNLATLFAWATGYEDR